MVWTFEVTRDGLNIIGVCCGDSIEAARHQVYDRFGISIENSDMAVLPTSTRYARLLNNQQTEQALRKQISILAYQLNAAEKGLRKAFSSQQVKHLNNWQDSGLVHPFTCGNLVCSKDRVLRNHDCNLVATEYGWFCPSCGYHQDWAHDFMLDGSLLDRISNQHISDIERHT